VSCVPGPPWLCISAGWYPLGTLLEGLYCDPVLDQVLAPPSGAAAMPTRLCLAVEYRRSCEQLVVSLLRLGNLPPRFHGNATLVELRLPPGDRRPRQARARGAGPDPEFTDDYFVFQVSEEEEEEEEALLCCVVESQHGPLCLSLALYLPVARHLSLCLNLS